mmetsp:Transcript_47509/g.154229  ORF Transcript_47509/g.154229 Transcript_47509/m.154229 type:complete len:585 (+) Transcript_47509:1928-3682(+)
MGGCGEASQPRRGRAASAPSSTGPQTRAARTRAEPGRPGPPFPKNRPLSPPRAATTPRLSACCPNARPASARLPPCTAPPPLSQPEPGRCRGDMRLPRRVCSGGTAHLLAPLCGVPILGLPQPDRDPALAQRAQLLRVRPLKRALPPRLPLPRRRYRAREREHLANHVVLLAKRMRTHCAERLLQRRRHLPPAARLGTPLLCTREPRLCLRHQLLHRLPHDGDACERGQQLARPAHRPTRLLPLAVGRVVAAVQAAVEEEGVHRRHLRGDGLPGGGEHLALDERRDEPVLHHAQLKQLGRKPRCLPEAGGRGCPELPPNSQLAAREAFAQIFPQRGDERAEPLPVLAAEHRLEERGRCANGRQASHPLEEGVAGQPRGVAAAEEVEDAHAAGEGVQHLAGRSVEAGGAEEGAHVPLEGHGGARLRVRHRRLADCEQHRRRVRLDLLDRAKQTEQDMKQVVQAFAAVGAQRVIVDHDNHDRARRRADGVPDVGRVGDVDLEAAVVEEAGTVGVCETRAEAARGLYLGRERHAFFRVADLHQLVRPRARLDANHLVLRANAASTNKARLLLRDALQPAALNHVDER